MPDSPRVYHRCYGCRREIKSMNVIWIKDRPYGTTCADIKRGVIKPKSRRKNLDLPRFSFDNDCPH